MPDPTTFDIFVRARAAELRSKDLPPRTLKEWQTRREALRKSMFAAMGEMPANPCELSPRIVGKLQREGYRIENILFQSRPDVWVTANAYVPETVKGKVPAVLAVHGHWAGARRDPVVQARCLGLVKLGFFVLVVDAFGAGERHPARAGYHGALLGSTLWPAGQTLLGLQVYDNRRAVDYMLTRTEVDGERLGITGASGGGNQSMYAGSLDERFKAVVPVCSVGNYQSYLQAACCVCEMLPGALRFTEEGDVLGLVAPRALMVISATKDAFQFSVGEAKKSLARAKAIFKLYDKEDKITHTIFDSPHAYNQAMREAMYGWMTRWLKGEGDGKPIPEPKHDVEKPQDLACYPDGKRPASFLFPPTFAAHEASRLLAGFTNEKLDHREAWEAKASLMRANLEEVLGGLPKKEIVDGDNRADDKKKDGIHILPLKLTVEPGLDLDVESRIPIGRKLNRRTCLLLHLDGKEKAVQHPMAAALHDKGWVIFVADLRATGGAKPKGDGISSAPDHNSTEHALWIGRPLLGQWLADVRAILAVIALDRALNDGRLAVVGIGQAGIVAITASALFPERIVATAAIDVPASYVTRTAYPDGTRMGLLVPGILRVGDIPHLAALSAPRKLIVAGGTTGEGKKLDEKRVAGAFSFTRKIYALMKAEKALYLRGEMKPAEVVELL
jgi:cephalosporin-C deacetylase-like acetyl esterase